ncbi:MAG: mannitol dehydrogenase family protein, partial [Paracoccaceae bacterium]
NDPDWDALQTRARAAKDNPALWLQMATVYGDLSQDPAVVAAFTAALHDVMARGTKAVLQDYIAG